jgi:hypothetical protein
MTSNLINSRTLRGPLNFDRFDRFDRCVGKVDLINESNGNLILFDNLAVGMVEEALLVAQELLERLGVELRAGILGCLQLLEFGSEAFLHYLKAILSKLGVEMLKVRNWSDCGQYSVVLEMWVAWAKRSDCRDTLLGTKCAKSLMVDVTTLENYCASLRPSQR